MDKNTVVLETTQGIIELKLTPDVAPKACENFKGLVEKVKGKTPKVKILGAHPKSAPFTKKIVVENCSVSKPAKAAIEKAGGNVK